MILEDLKRFRDAWLKLDFGEPTIRTMETPRVLRWELREGFYIVAFSQSRGSADTLQLVPLHSEIPDPLPLHFDFTFSDFAADPGQGLVAMISEDPDRPQTCHVYLCSSTTGLAHPLAECPRLSARFGSDFPLPFCEYTTEIMGHVVVTKICYAEANVYELLIWNWRSGIFLQRISSREGICAFTFLDQQHLAVLNITRSGPGQDILALLIYALRETTPTLSHISSDEGWRVEGYPISKPVLHLEFPRLNELSKITEDRLILQSDPIPGHTLYTKSAAFASSYAMILNIIFSFDGSDHGLDISDYHCIFIDGWSLLKHLRANPQKETRILPWSAWGSNATRWFVAPETPSYWVCWISGSKYIRPLSEIGSYCVLDFSSRVSGLFGEDYSTDGPELGDTGLLESLESALCKYVTKSRSHLEPVVIKIGADNPSTIYAAEPDEPGFEESFTTRLPYRIACKVGHEKLEDEEEWQINQDCLIGVDPQGPPSEALAIYRINV